MEIVLTAGACDLSHRVAFVLQLSSPDPSMRAASVAREIDAEEPPSKRPALAAHSPSNGDAATAIETKSAVPGAAASAHPDAGTGIGEDDAAGAGETKEKASEAVTATDSGATCKPDESAAEATSSDRAAADKDMFETLACPICQEVGVTRRMSPSHPHRRLFPPCDSSSLPFFFAFLTRFSMTVSA
jgi:hypothetical protein